MKNISLFFSVLGFFAILFSFKNNFYKIKLSYIVNYKQSCFVKDFLVCEKRYNVDGEPTNLYYIEGYLKDNKEKKIISGYEPSLDKNKQGEYLVWYCNWNNQSFLLKRKQKEDHPSKFLGGAYFNILLIILFIPSFINYIRLLKK